MSPRRRFSIRGGLDLALKGIKTVSACCVFAMLHLVAVHPCSGQSAARPEPPGWFAGDAHVHRGICCGRAGAKEMLTPEELLEGMKANNLAVVSVLADIGNGECKYVERDLPLMNGDDHAASTPERLLHWDAEWHYDPKGVTFEQKVIGGHLIILGLRRGETIFAEYAGPIFEWARNQNAVAGFAHMQYLPEDVPHDLDCCLPLEFPVETALGTCSFLMEDVRGNDTALRAYYRILNCGFRPGLVAATDFPCNNLKPFGTLLTYVYVRDGKLTYRKWVDGIARGRTVISRNAHDEFLDLEVNETARPGDEIRMEKTETVRVTVRWSATKKLAGRIELVRDGVVVVTRDGSASPDSPLIVQTTLAFERSGWLCARRMDEHGHQSHTGAVFVIVQGAPIRTSASDAEFFVRWTDHLIRQTSPGGAWIEYFSKNREAAQSRYRKAKAIYEKIAAEARQQSRANATIPLPARPRNFDRAEGDDAHGSPGRDTPR